MVGALGVNQALAVHRGVRARRRCSPGSAARCRCRASRPTSSIDLTADRRRLRRRRGRRHGLDRRRLPRRAADRRGQGVLHRRRRGRLFGVDGQLLQAHAGRRVPGHGGRAGRAALRACSASRRRRARCAPSRRRRCGRAGRAGGARRRRLLALLLALPLLAPARRTSLVLGDRRADRGAVRRQPALHHGAGRHAFVRPCRLFRPRRLRRGAAGEGARRADGGWRWCSRRWSPRFGALLFGWFCVRLSGVYLAMLTLAFAQIVWSVVFQWDDFTGGSNGLIGIWPPPLARRQAGLLLAHAAPARSPACCCCGACCSRRSATRCAPAAIRRCAPRRSASTCSACSGSPSSSPARRRARRRRCSRSPRAASRPRRIGVGQSVDGLVMVLLGGVQTLAGPSSAPRSSPGCRTRSARRPTTGARCSARIILLLVLVFPQGIVGAVATLLGAAAEARRRHERAAAGRAPVARRSAASARSTTSASTSRRASCWR